MSAPESIISNATQAEGTRVNAPPYEPSPAAQSRINEIKADKAYWEIGTPRQRELVAEMHGLLTGATSAPKGDVTENQAAIRALNQSGKLLSNDPVVKAAALKELRERIAAESSDIEKQTTAALPLDQLREQYNLDHGQALPPLRNAWDETAEADLIGAMAIRGVEPKAVAALHHWFVDVFNGSVGKIENIDPVQIETDFRDKAKKLGLADDLVENIVKAEKARLGL
jgi:hypothetical protein